MPGLVGLVDSDDSSNEGNASPSLTNRTASTGNFMDSSDLGEDLDTPILPHIGHKKVLVTGGAGFIGSHTAEFLLARGDDVVIVDEVGL